MSEYNNMPKRSKKFQYKPLSLKDIIREMKQNIDLMIDLAYSAIKFGSKELADEAYKMEQRIHELTFLLNFQIIQAHPGGLTEAKTLEPIVVMGYSIDKISDALSDIARTVYINSDISYFVQLFSDISIVPEPIVKIAVKKDCGFIGQIRKDVHFRSRYGVDLIAIRRGNKWLFEKDEKLHMDDILIVKGEIQPIIDLKALCKDPEPFSFQIGKKDEEFLIDLGNPDICEKIEKLQRNYVLITDVSETMIELALAALFFKNEELAEDILEMEELMDGLNLTFEKDLLDLAQLVETPRDLTGIMRIVFSCELIADSATHIAENIIKGFEPHSILQQAIHETSEIVVRETLSEDSYFKAKTYNELQDRRYKRGFHIIALKREDIWIYRFQPDFIFEEGDLLIGLGPKETLMEWRRCVNPEKYKE
ncbi:MAG: potassium channel family protein [Candidatus Hodarchaeota archaeon]